MRRCWKWIGVVASATLMVLAACTSETTIINTLPSDAGLSAVPTDSGNAPVDGGMPTVTPDSATSTACTASLECIREDEPNNQPDAANIAPSCDKSTGAQKFRFCGTVHGIYDVDHFDFVMPEHMRTWRFSKSTNVDVRMTVEGKEYTDHPPDLPGATIHYRVSADTGTFPKDYEIWFEAIYDE